MTESGDQPPHRPTPPTGHFLAGMAPMPPISSAPVYDRFRAQLEIDGPLPQRRWTVALRLVLVLPLVLLLIPVATAVTFTVIVSWFCALVLGRVPRWAAGFLTGYIAWATRTYAYGVLLTDRYPGVSFAPDAGAVRVEVQAERVSRWRVLVRWFLFVPVGLMTQFLLLGWAVLSIPIWLAVLVRGRMPQALFGATAAVVRVQLRGWAYLYLLTDAYPLVQVFGDRPDVGRAAAVETPDTPGRPMIRTRPLRLSGGAKVILSFFIGLGVIAYVGEVAADAFLNSRVRSITAATDTYLARDALDDGFVRQARALRKCAGRLDCLEKRFDEMSKDADRFADRIDGIDYPEDARVEAAALESEGRTLAQTARRISNAPVGHYNQVLRSSHIDAEYGRVYTDATALGRKLG